MSLTLIISDEQLEAIAQCAANIVVAHLAEQDRGRSPWLSGAKEAAQYLDWPVERVYKRLAAMPHYREGGRLMFRRDALDAWLSERREGRAR